MLQAEPLLGVRVIVGLREKPTYEVRGQGFSTSAPDAAGSSIRPLERKLPRYPSVPAVLIGWLSRDVAFRGQQVASMLLADAIARLAASPIGVHAICADAIDAAAASFYEEHQFQRFVSRPQSLYLTMKTAAAPFAKRVR